MLLSASIDEFKGNTPSDKYQVILTKKALDILRARTKHQVIKYFKQYIQEQSQQLLGMLGCSADLYATVFLKEQLYKIL